MENCNICNIEKESKKSSILTVEIVVLGIAVFALLLQTVNSFNTTNQLILINQLLKN
jgi:hypothetical protein